MGKAIYDDIVGVLKKEYNPEKIILFGSCVPGKINRDSDIDMLIIKRTKKSYAQRWLEVGKLVRNMNKTLPFEPFILTLGEIKKQAQNNLFLQEIIRTGKVLYEKK